MIRNADLIMVGKSRNPQREILVDATFFDYASFIFSIMVQEASPARSSRAEETRNIACFKSTFTSQTIDLKFTIHVSFLLKRQS